MQKNDDLKCIGTNLLIPSFMDLPIASHFKNHRASQEDRKTYLPNGHSFLGRFKKKLIFLNVFKAEK